MSYEVKTVNINEICSIERARGEYEKGTVYIRLSACEGVIEILNKNKKIFGDYAVFLPKVRMDTEYLKIALEMSMPKFLAKHQGSNINLSFNDLKWLDIKYHEEINQQKEIIKRIKYFDNCEEIEKKEIEKLKTLKKVMLSKMIPGDKFKPHTKETTKQEKTSNKQQYRQLTLEELLGG